MAISVCRSSSHVAEWPLWTAVNRGVVDGSFRREENRTSAQGSTALGREKTRALAVGLGLVALASLVVAFFADTDSTFYLRVIGFLVCGAAGLASRLAFIKARK